MISTDLNVANTLDQGVMQNIPKKISKIRLQKNFRPLLIWRWQRIHFQIHQFYRTIFGIFGVGLKKYTKRVRKIQMRTETNDQILKCMLS